jgi:hypothetical protein
VTKAERGVYVAAGLKVASATILNDSASNGTAIAASQSAR